jgi:hypothetical protein
VLTVGKVMLTVGAVAGSSVALGTAPWGKLSAAATGSLLFVENAQNPNAVPTEKTLPTSTVAMMTPSLARRRRAGPRPRFATVCRVGPWPLMVPP